MTSLVFPTTSGRKPARTAWAYPTPDGAKGPLIYPNDLRDKSALIDSLLGGLSYDELILLTKLIEARLIGMLQLNVSSIKILAELPEKESTGA